MVRAQFGKERKRMEKRYDVLTSIVWEFNGFSNFAATAGETPMYDFDGKQIQDLLNPSVPARHVYTCVFPENGKTYVIIAWLKEYDGLFLPMKKNSRILKNLLISGQFLFHAKKIRSICTIFVERKFMKTDARMKMIWQ